MTRDEEELLDKRLEHEKAALCRLPGTYLSDNIMGIVSCAGAVIVCIGFMGELGWDGYVLYLFLVIIIIDL